LFLGAGALAVIGIGKLSDNSKVDDERAAVTAAAGQLAVTSPRSTTRACRRSSPTRQKLATPDFAKKYLATVTAFAPLYRKGKVVQNTSVDVSGIQSMTATTAVVLVALKGIATNTAISQREPAAVPHGDRFWPRSEDLAREQRAAAVSDVGAAERERVGSRELAGGSRRAGAAVGASRQRAAGRRRGGHRHR